MKTKRGYFGLALYDFKFPSNISTLLRTAAILDCSFIAIIGNRYQHHATDTMKVFKHVPLFHYATFDEFKKTLPVTCELIGIEMGDNATSLADLKHPERGCYLLGAEDYGLPNNILQQCDKVIKLDGDVSFNVAVAGSIVLYHRESL